MEKLFKSKITGKWVVVGAGAYATEEEAQKVYTRMYGEDKPETEDERTAYVGILLPQEMKSRLQQHAKRNGMNLSALTRKIITDFLKEAEKNV